MPVPRSKHNGGEKNPKKGTGVLLGSRNGHWAVNIHNTSEKMSSVVVSLPWT